MDILILRRGFTISERVALCGGLGGEGVLGWF
jgi:hypothetical protein